MPYTIDPTAPTMAEDYELKGAEDVAPIMTDVQFICESVEDNDVERWLLTKAGQFVRNTGVESDRFYVVPPEEAFDMLNDWVEDDVMADLKTAGAFRDVNTDPTP